MESNFDRSQYCAQKNVGTEHMIVTFAVMGDKSQVVSSCCCPIARGNWNWERATENLEGHIVGATQNSQFLQNMLISPCFGNCPEYNHLPLQTIIT